MMKGELEELGEDTEGIESISKIQTQILNLTKGKVNIFDANNNFKSTYEILKEISEVYNDLSQTDQASLTEIIFGKLRSNQGLAVISAFQSGQIEKALKDARNAAGTANEEMQRYSESITAHIKTFKEAIQELSSDAIRSGLIKNIIDEGTEAIETIDHLTKLISELVDLVSLERLNASIREVLDASETLKGIVSGATAIIKPFTVLFDAIEKIYSVVTANDISLTDDLSEFSKEIKSLTDRYIELQAEGEDVAEITEQLGKLQDNINEKYATATDSLDLYNKSLAENLSLAQEFKRNELADWLRENADKYREAAQKLDEVKTMTIDAVGIGGYTEKQYAAFESLGLSNYERAASNGYAYDFSLSGTYQERLDSLIKIRDVYATLDDYDQTRLLQFDNEIKKLQEAIKEGKQYAEVLQEQEDAYKSLLGGTVQEYNMLEQAINAYHEYTNAAASGNTEMAENARTSLNGIKDIIYSISEPTSELRKQFDEVWNKFTFGAEQSVDRIDEIKSDFDDMVDAFKGELENLEKAEAALDAMYEDTTLSHEDAWELFKLDTQGVLKDIQLVNGQYKLSTDEIVKLIEQRIKKEKESIQTSKAAAEAELESLRKKLASFKINSPDAAKQYSKEITDILAKMDEAKDIIQKDDYLLAEIDGRMASIKRSTDATAKNLQAQVDKLEAEVDAVDDAIDSLNERKDILNDEKDALQEQLDILNEQKEAIEQTIKNYDAVADAVNDYIGNLTDGIQKEIDALEEERDAIEDYYDKQIEALEKQNEERDAAIKKEKALADLANAENQKKRTYSSARGWTYESDKAAIVEAQNALAEIETDEKIKALENEREEKLSGFDERKKEYEDQIKTYEDYAEKYADVSADIQKAENEKLADLILGSEWRVKIEQTDEELLRNYSNEYKDYTNQLNDLVNGEIADINRAIEAKEKEMKTIDNEIKAYEKYKSSVEKSLKEAQTALDNYKSTVSQASTDVSKSLETMEGNTWDRANKVVDDYDRMANAAESAKDRINNALDEIGNASERLKKRLAESATGYGIINSAGDARLLEGYSSGGIADFTGKAMLHGTRNKPEIVLNNTDSKKLYDMIHNTPNVMASMIKQATQIAGFNPSNVSNNTANSINVNIGQVVANNPQELTRNLDTHLDSYFRRKLTQGYTQ